MYNAAQVETIRNLVDSYILIVIKTIKDQTPKMIMCLLLNSTRTFIAEELVARLYSECNPSNLMEESQVEVDRKRELMRIYKALKEAVKIVADINMTTHSTPTPAPVDYDWVDSSSNRVSRGAPPPPRPSVPQSYAAPPMPQSNDPFAELRSITGPSGWSNNATGGAPAPAIPARNSPNVNQMSSRPPPAIPRRPQGQAPQIPSRPSNFGR